MSHNFNAATSSGGRLVTSDGRALPLRDTQLRVEARGGIARAVLKQHFVNPYDEPLAVRYQVPLPADGAVSGFAFTLGDERIVGEIDTNTQARERYEQAIIQGHSAALLEQDRSSLFTQDVGNIPAGETVVSEIIIDQKLRWLSEGRWEWRFPTVVAPRYLGGEGHTSDAVKVEVDVADGPLERRAHLALDIGDTLPEGARPESTSHAITVAHGQVTAVGFRDEDGARLDRDVVVSWPTAGAEVCCTLACARPAADHAGAASSYGLLTVVPPRMSAMPTVSRDLILLLDTSGSMHGEPLDQARRVALALVDTLGPDDSLQMIDFNWRARRWGRSAKKMTDSAKRKACKWLQALEAGGATEMHTGILAALEPLRDDAQRQVVVMSDGLIGFEHEVVGAIVNRLPKGSRVHMVGVGSGVNRSLTAPAARAGRGVETIIGIGEDPERCAQRLVAHTAAPIVVDLELSGSAVQAHAPVKLPDLFEGAPALIPLMLDAAGGELVIGGRTPDGAWEQRLSAAPLTHGDGNAGITALFARELVEDLDTERAATHDNSEHEAIDERVEALGIDHQIATRMTSWVAVSDAQLVDPADPSRKETIAHELPHGMSVERLGLRSATQLMHLPAAATMTLAGYAAAPPVAAGPPPAPQPMPERVRSLAGAKPMRKSKSGVASRFVDALRGMFDADEEADEEAVAEQLQQLLLDGRIVLQKAERLTIEIVIPVTMSWEPELLQLTLTDGTAVDIELVSDESTRFGEVPTGRMLRLTVAWSGPLSAAPRSLAATSGGISITVRL